MILNLTYALAIDYYAWDRNLTWRERSSDSLKGYSGSEGYSEVESMTSEDDSWYETSEGFYQEDTDTEV